MTLRSWPPTNPPTNACLPTFVRLEREHLLVLGRRDLRQRTSLHCDWSRSDRREPHWLFGATNAVEVVYDPPEKWVMADDYAFIHYTSLARITLADGSLNEVGTRTTIVAHRGADGFWRYILDHNSAL